MSIGGLPRNQGRFGVQKPAAPAPQPVAVAEAPPVPVPVLTVDDIIDDLRTPLRNVALGPAPVECDREVEPASEIDEDDRPVRTTRLMGLPRPVPTYMSEPTKAAAPKPPPARSTGIPTPTRSGFGNMRRSDPATAPAASDIPEPAGGWPRRARPENVRKVILTPDDIPW